MYSLVLVLHSWARWGALALGIAATFLSATDRSGSRAGRAGLLFVLFADIQLLLGLTLYLVLSPFTAAALHDFGAAMRAPALRYWAVEHAATMLIAVILVHVGRVLGRSATPSPAK